MTTVPRRHRFTVEEYYQVADRGLVHGARVEVADSTLKYDLETKVPLYEKHGIPEVWVVDLAGRQVHVFQRQGPGERYAAQIARPPSRLVACGVSVEVSSLFPG